MKEDASVSWSTQERYHCQHREAAMAQLVVRNIEEEVVIALKKKAALTGRSAEAEHREILRVALLEQPPLSFKELLLSMPDVGEDADFARVQDLGRVVDL